MDANHHIYELEDFEQRLVKEGPPGEATEAEKAHFDKLREDVARLDGYLKGRADSDREKILGQGIGKALGAGSNGDLAG